ncbi:MAG TPA: DUF4398 domain-containing protein [Myxococcota bacterium]
MKQIVLSALALSAALVGGCATAQLSTDRVASSEAAIRSADELGAAQVPQAALHLKLAQEQLVQAKKLNDDGEHERADLVLARANADAELAVALVKEANAEQQAMAVQSDISKIEGKTP